MAKPTAEQRVQRATLQLMRDHDKKYVYLSGIFMLGSTSVLDKEKSPYPTAGTNGRDVFYSRPWVEEQNDKQLKMAVLHENMHKAYRHMSIWQHLFKKNRTLANVACDIVINNELVRDKELELPLVQGKPSGMYDFRFDGMNAAQIFTILEKEQKQGKQGQGQGGGGGGQGQSQPGKGKGKPEKGDGQGQPQPGQGDPNGTGHVYGWDIPEDGGGFDQHDWESLKEALGPEGAKELEGMIDQALRRGSILAGKTGSGGNRELTEFLKPKLDWKTLLREYIKNVTKAKDFSSWSRPNRRFMAQGMLMPGWTGESVGRISTWIDESGSVSHQLQMRFLSEVKSICEEVNPEILDVVMWDTQCGKHEMFKGGDTQAEEFAAKIRPAGGGGTSPSCIPPYKNANDIHGLCNIVLTDGYVGGDWGEHKEKWDEPVLWVICGDNSAVPTCGTVIYIDESDLDD